MLTNTPIPQVKSGQKTQKFQGHLILCYAGLVAEEPLIYKYGYSIYEIRPDRLRSINPKVADCYLPANSECFGYPSDTTAIKAAKQAITEQLEVTKS